ncbi:MAG TPA: hypothetical protein VHC63_10050 [Acidimicrobiales bacterium]|nr:hypothetical protein [Acidimicrobiales bacterium]
MNTDIDETLNALAVGQFGAVSRAQAYGRGIRADALDRRILRGIFRSATSRVLVSNSPPDSFEQRASIAILDGGPDAALSVFSTLAWVGLSGFALEPIHVSRPRRDGRLPSAGIVWHHPRNLRPEHLIEINGLITTTPTRALADMIALPNTRPKRCERALDNARSARLTNHVLRPVAPAPPELVRERRNPSGRSRRGF